MGPDQPELRSYRTAVRSFIPTFSEAEVVLHRHQFLSIRTMKLTKSSPSGWPAPISIVDGNTPTRDLDSRPICWPSPCSSFRKVGGAADLAIRIPTRETQHWYFHSVNRT